MITRLIPPAKTLLESGAPCLRFPPGLQLSLFSTTCSHSDKRSINHYEVLRIKPDCTPAELKKYALCLHPTTKDSQLTLPYQTVLLAFSNNPSRHEPP